MLQRYPKLEYVVMDGGSTDGSVSVLDRYRRHFHHFESAKDQGQADAIRRGFEHTSGEIMAYLNSDDLLAPETLYTVAQFFTQNPQVDCLYSHRCAIDASNRVIWYWHLPPHSNYLMRRWDLIPQETCFWRRSLYERAGAIDPSYRFAMDYDLFVRFMRKGRLQRIDRFLGAFRQHPEAKTSTQIDDIGAKEIQRVWHTYGLRPRRWDPVVGPAFERIVQIRSFVFAETGKRRPGVRPGVGYSYDQLWAGQLADPRIPPVDHSRFDE